MIGANIDPKRGLYLLADGYFSGRHGDNSPVDLREVFRATLHCLAEWATQASAEVTGDEERVRPLPTELAEKILNIDGMVARVVEKLASIPKWPSSSGISSDSLPDVRVNVDEQGDELDQLPDGMLPGLSVNLYEGSEKLMGQVDGFPGALWLTTGQYEKLQTAWASAGLPQDLYRPTKIA